MRYDSGHRMTSSIDPEGARTTYAYNAQSQVTSVTQPNGQRVTKTLRARDAHRYGTLIRRGIDDVSVRCFQRIRWQTAEILVQLQGRSVQWGVML